MGLAEENDPVSHAVPKVGIVARPASYRTTHGILVDQDEYDLAVRMVSMHAPPPGDRPHLRRRPATAAATP